MPCSSLGMEEMPGEALGAQQSPPRGEERPGLAPCAGDPALDVPASIGLVQKQPLLQPGIPVSQEKGTPHTAEGKNILGLGLREFGTRCEPFLQGAEQIPPGYSLSGIWDTV